MKKHFRSELAISLGIGLVLLSLIIPTGWFIHLRRPVRMARDDLRRLVDAGQRFTAEYGAWDARRKGEPGDIRFGQDVPNWELINALCAVDGPGNEAHVANPHRIVFLDVRPYKPGISGVDTNGEFLDPWGMPYQIVLDADADGVCKIDNTIYGTGIGLGLMVWSCGPDRRSDTPDDLLSWTEKDRVRKIGDSPKPFGPPLANPPY